MRRIKLLPKPILKEATELHTIGVPIAKILRDLKLDISRPVLSNLIKWHKLGETLEDSLFPEWLDNSLANVQEQPDEYLFQGCFPAGHWVKK